MLLTVKDIGTQEDKSCFRARVKLNGLDTTESVTVLALSFTLQRKLDTVRTFVKKRSMVSFSSECIMTAI